MRALDWSRQIFVFISSVKVAACIVVLIKVFDSSKKNTISTPNNVDISDYCLLRRKEPFLRCYYI